MRLLVTGGAGFIGSHLVRACLDAGDQVRILDDFSTGSERNLDGIARRVELHKASVVDLEAVLRAAHDCEVILHCAAIASVVRSIEDPVGSALVNETGTLHVLEAARRGGTRRVVLASSAAIYGADPTVPKTEDMPARPESPYALHKWASERHCEQFSRLYGVDTVSLRYFNVYGPRQDPASQYAGVIARFFAAAVSRQPPTIYGDGHQTRDFVYVGDAVAAARAAALADRALAGMAVNVASARGTSLLELLGQIAAALGEPVPEPVFAAERPGDLRHSEADISRAGSLLGWCPQVPLEAGLRETAAYYRGAQE